MKNSMWQVFPYFEKQILKGKKKEGITIDWN